MEGPVDHSSTSVCPTPILPVHLPSATTHIEEDTYHAYSSEIIELHDPSTCFVPSPTKVLLEVADDEPLYGTICSASTELQDPPEVADIQTHVEALLLTSAATKISPLATYLQASEIIEESAAFIGYEPSQ